jgi:hypothetical protein
VEVDPASIPTAERYEGLLHEYAQCNEFYNSRDAIAGDIFSKLIQSFSAFSAILVAINIFGRLPSVIYLGIVGAIGLFGLVSFISMTLDMEGACSVKVAARLRAQQIERQLEKFGGPRLWHDIADRQVFFEERLLKLSKLEGGGEAPSDAPGDAAGPGSGVAGGRQERETEGSLFVFGARLAVVLWTVLVVLIMVSPGLSAR